MTALRIERVRGPTLSQPGQEVTPFARVIQLTWPGGITEWRRPVAVEVRRGNRVRHIPIRDATRRAQVIIALTGLAICGLATAARVLQRRVSR